MKKPKKIEQLFLSAQPGENSAKIGELVEEHNNLVEVVNTLYDMLRKHQRGEDEECLEILDD